MILTAGAEATPSHSARERPQKKERVCGCCSDRASSELAFHSAPHQKYLICCYDVWNKNDTLLPYETSTGSIAAPLQNRVTHPKASIKEETVHDYMQYLACVVTTDMSALYLVAVTCHLILTDLTKDILIQILHEKVLP